jgi:hypothetical protein
VAAGTLPTGGGGARARDLPARLPRRGRLKRFQREARCTRPRRASPAQRRFTRWTAPGDDDPSEARRCPTVIPAAAGFVQTAASGVRGGPRPRCLCSCRRRSQRARGPQRLSPGEFVGHRTAPCSQPGQ